jgi:DNA-binding transcriptional LysR family regulator
MALIDRVAHRLKLRDLRLLEAVVQCRSIAKAASHLNLTPPAVSKALSELEHTIGVRLIERSRQGVESTPHGKVLIERGRAIFDELRQGVSEIEYLSDPAAGEIRVAAATPIAAGVLPMIVGRMARRYPRISIHAREIPIAALQFHSPAHRELRERVVDLVIGPAALGRGDEDLECQTLYVDPLCVATGKPNATEFRRTKALKDLIDERWCLPTPDSVAGNRCVEAFRKNGLGIPTKIVWTISVHLQIGLLATERYFTMFPGSLMRFGARQYPISELPIALSVPSLPVCVLTLKGRTISPAARIFIETARAVTKPFSKAA